MGIEDGGVWEGYEGRASIGVRCFLRKIKHGNGLADSP